jgi:hypothetical protein
MSPRLRERLLPALILILPAPVLAQGAFLEGGISLARGDYVYTAPTSSGAASLGLAYSTPRLTARVTVPYFLRDTRLLTVRGFEPVEPVEPVEPAPESGQYTGSLADPVVQLFVSAHRGDRTSVGLSASVKIPVLEAGDFGTGRWDVGGGLSLSRFVGSGTLVGLDLGFWRLGDPPDLDLQDTVTGTLTIGRPLGRLWSASASLSGGRSAVAGYADPWWASLLVSRVAARGIWGLTASVGLTETAPDFTLGLLFRLKL